MLILKKIAVFLSVSLIITSCFPASARPAAVQAVPAKANATVTAATNATSTPPAAPSGQVPNFDHIVMILLENRNYADAIGNPQMPHLNALARQNVLLSNYFAVHHPSLGNYIALMSGSTQNITKDCTNCFMNQPNLADLIEASGHTWKSYLENMPSPCFIGDEAPYVQRHNPLLYFDSVRLNTARCEHSIVPLTNLDDDLAANQLPDFSFIMPNLCNSGHDCTADVTDTWIDDMVTRLQSSTALGKNSLIIITFDEASEHNTGTCCGLGPKAGGQVATVLISPSGPHGFIDNNAYSHYSLLKMILSAWKLPDLGQSASAPQILAPWKAGANYQTDIAHSVQPAAATNCTSSGPSSGAYTATVCFTSPAPGSTLTGNATVSATVSVTGTSPGVQRMVFYLDGSYLLTDYQGSYSFTLPTTKWVDGVHAISVEALMRDNFTTQRSSLSASFNNGITSPPVNNNHFQPTSGIPATNGAPFIVAVGGDGASGETNAANVSNLIASINPNLFLYLGDVYEKGSKAEFYNWYGKSSTFFGRFRSITDPTVGNHEYTNGAAPGYFDYWNNIPNYYSFNANGWHFISLNSNASFVPVNPQSAQYKWLQQDLAANTAACTIVYYHHPLFNIGQEGPTTAMSDVWSLLAQNGVDIVLNGHDHDYQRWVPLDGAGQPNPNGITEFVAGGAGHGLQTFTSSDSRVAYSNASNPAAFGALLLQLNQSGANFSYRSTNGSILDSGVIPCVPAGSDTQAPTKPGGLSATASSATQVDLTWSASSDNTGVSGYTIYRNGTSIGTTLAANLAYSDKSAAPNTTYNYTIDAFDLAGNHSATADPVSVTTPGMPNSLTISVAADTYVSSSSPTSNYGAATSWRLDSSPDLHAYLRFNVQGLGGTPITQARLLIYANNSSTLGLSAKSVADNSWSELSINYNNAPALGSSLATSGAFTAATWVSLDVTSYVKGEGTYTFGITTPSSSALSFPSRESGANSAQLVLSFSGSPAPTPTNAPTPTSIPVATSTPAPAATATASPTTAPVGSSVTFAPVADTYVNAGSTTSNYGSSTTLRADASPDVHSYLRFSVSGLGGKTVAKATLRIFANSSSTTGISTLTVADNTWDELAMNYTNAPALGNTLASSGAIATGSWVTLDVTPYITGEGIFSLGITTANSTAISLASRESGANAPQLVIDLK